MGIGGTAKLYLLLKCMAFLLDFIPEASSLALGCRHFFLGRISLSTSVSAGVHCVVQTCSTVPSHGPCAQPGVVVALGCSWAQ